MDAPPGPFPSNPGRVQQWLAARRPVPIVAVLVVYLIILLAIGVWGGRESHSVAGYYVANKKLPAWVITAIKSLRIS